MSQFEFRPARTYQEALQRAAEMCGIEPQFWDIFGVQHVATPEAQRAILASFGIPSETIEDLDRAVEERHWRQWSQFVPETIVLTHEKSCVVPLCLPVEQADATVEIKVACEDGATLRRAVRLAELPVEERAHLRGHSFVRKLAPLPDDLPLGYHELAVTVMRNGAHLTEGGRLILAPARAYQPPFLAAGKCAGGVAVSLYGLRSQTNWGCGDTSDLRRLVDWIADDVHGSFIALNPLHAIPNRAPYNTSPYLPTCSLYRNFIYIDIEQTPEFRTYAWARRFAGSPRLRAEREALRNSEHVEYERVSRLKKRFLKLLFRAFRREIEQATPRAKAFQEFVEREGEPLHLYAVHEVLDEAMHRHDREVWNWHSWPAEYQDPHSPATQEFAARHARSVLFYKWLQWLLDEQFAAVQAYAKERGLPIGLYHDLALATDRFGGDLWSERPFYVEGCRVGAPPDDFSPKGQDWSFPPPNSLQHRRDGYQLFRESIRKNCRHGGALRIDHVMRFFRLYWIPDTMDPSQGVYVRDFSEDLLRILALESVRQQVVVIGEDLGTVAPSVRESLARFGILSYRLLYFEKEPDGAFKSPDQYPRQALVSVSTHDLPTLAGFWLNRDIDARRDAGLLPDEATYRRIIEERMREKQKMLDLFRELNLLPWDYPRSAAHIPEFTGDLHSAAVGFLTSTPSALMVLNQEDLFKDPEQQNLPGSTAEYPNWRHKMRFTVEELRTDPFAQGCAAMLRHWLERTGRGMERRGC